LAGRLPLPCRGGMQCLRRQACGLRYS
jgi:hypothetical protein